MPEIPNEKISRRRFLRLGAAAIPAVALVFLSACGGEEDGGDKEEGGEEDD